MAFSNDSNGAMYMPVAPAYMGGYNNSGFGGGFGGDGWWLILLLLCGWGGGFGGGFGGLGGMMGMGMEFPWLLTGQNQINANTNAGFDHAATQAALGNLSTAVTAGFGDVQNAMTTGFGGVQNSLCGGFAGVTAAVNGAQNALAQQMYGNQIADLERSFAAQTATTQGMTGIQSQLAQCCCDNRAATADLKYTIATENCADRSAISDGIKDILTATQAQTQAILNQMCNDKIESKNDTIAQLRSELMYARGQASQDVQTAAIQAGQRALANEVEQYVAPRPIPSYYVQNPNCCAGNFTGCGCGA